MDVSCRLVPRKILPKPLHLCSGVDIMMQPPPSQTFPKEHLPTSQACTIFQTLTSQSLQLGLRLLHVPFHLWNRVRQTEYDMTMGDMISFLAYLPEILLQRNKFSEMNIAIKDNNVVVARGLFSAKPSRSIAFHRERICLNTGVNDTRSRARVVTAVAYSKKNHRSMPVLLMIDLVKDDFNIDPIPS